MEINGKIYRNLEGQVGYLTEKWDDLQDQINDVKGKLTHYIVVEELPTEDIDTFAVYLVGPKGTEPDTYYEEWVYVETSEGTWSWEKLGDTASVDLSGYLEKVETVTTGPQAYVKNSDGTQAMIDIYQNQTSGNSIARRTSGGQLVCAAPQGNNDAVTLYYADVHYVAKVTTTTTYPQVYIKKADGTQDTVNFSDGANAYTMALRNSAGILKTKDPVNSEDSVNLSYANDHYLAKDTTTSTYNKVYTKLTDGTQAVVEMADTARYNALVRRTNQAQIILPNQAVYPPTDDQAVSKRYVDNVVGQLLYLHDIDLAITIDSTNKLFVKAYLINDDPTAITSFNRSVYKRLDVQWGAFGQHSYNADAAAVTKLPKGFRQDDLDEPLVGFLYQYFSGGNLISGTTDNIMTTTVTDTVISW